MYKILYIGIFNYIFPTIFFPPRTEFNDFLIIQLFKIINYTKFFFYQLLEIVLVINKPNWHKFDNFIIHLIHKTLQEKFLLLPFFFSFAIIIFVMLLFLFLKMHSFEGKKTKKESPLFVVNCVKCRFIYEVVNALFCFQY